MELNYIWVENYKIIEKTGFNFSNSRGLSFIYEKNKLIPNFGTKPILDFGPAICSVTAIAGQNGSGKSSLCEVIIRSLATLVNGSIGYKHRFRGIVSLGNYILKHESIQLENIRDLVQHGFELRDYKESPLDIFFPLRDTQLLNLGFVYYSNIIDWKSGYDETNLSNISTQNLIFDSIKYSPFYSYSNWDSSLADENRYKDLKDPIQGLFLEDSHKSVKFILDCPEIFPFLTLESFHLCISHPYDNRWLNLDTLDPSKNRAYYEILQSIAELVYSETIDKPLDGKYILEQHYCRNLATKLYRLNLSFLLAKEKEIFIDSKSLHNFVFNDFFPVEYTPYFQLITTILEYLNVLITNSSFYAEFSPIATRISTRADWRLNIIHNFSIENTATNRDALKAFLHAEEKLARDENKNRLRISYCQFSPRPSAGETSFLTLISRIYFTLKDYQDGYDRKTNIILFIDEGDMAFHPDWKKRMLYWLTTFLNSKFPSHQFQLILTSHSPYLLSDLHTENLILLKRDKNRTKVVKADSNRTFGANIHELLADSFFMENGFIGEYAKDKLEKLVKYLQENETENNEWNQKKARDLISIIGDDIIRTRLEDLYFDKFQEPLESLKDEYDRLRIRLNEIRKELGE